MDKENITITGLGKQKGIRISTPEHPSYMFKYVPVQDNIDEVRFGIQDINTEARLIQLIIQYMKHCSEKCTHVPDKEQLRFDYNES